MCFNHTAIGRFGLHEGYRKIRGGQQLLGYHPFIKFESANTLEIQTPSQKTRMKVPITAGAGFLLFQHRNHREAHGALTGMFSRNY
jgi:hypothetical protein